MNADELVAQAARLGVEAERAVRGATDLDALAEIERTLIKGALGEIKRGIKDVENADRSRVGKAFAEADAHSKMHLVARRAILESDLRTAAIESERLESIILRELLDQVFVTLLKPGFHVFAARRLGRCVGRLR